MRVIYRHLIVLNSLLDNPDAGNNELHQLLLDNDRWARD